VTAVPPSAVDEAEEALGLVLAQPRKARALAAVAREHALSAGDAAAVSVAERALGLAAKELKDIAAAATHLRRAVRVAERAAADERAAEARMSLSLVLAYAGDTTAALREANRAAEVLTGDEAARLQMQRALILQRLGRQDDALEGYRRALALFRRNGDLSGEARLLNNRGLLYGYRGAFAAAERDLVRAELLHLSIGDELAAAEARHNLGWVAARSGDVPTALQRFDEADEYFVANGVPRGMYLRPRCELLLSVHLIDEARTAARQAVQELGEGRLATDVAEARLLLAEATLLAGDYREARAEASRALRAFRRQQRPGWAALAAHVRLRASWAAGNASVAALGEARTTAADLSAAGWIVPALDARLIAARMALALGRVDEAGDELVTAATARRRGPVGLRTRAWHAEALLREQNRDRSGAYSALRAGLRLVDQHRAALGATELRAHVSAHAEELASMGLRLALEDSNPARVFAWAERWRAGSLRVPPVHPPHDARLSADLAPLREVVSELSQAAATGGDTVVLLRRQAEIEQRIRRRWQALPGAEGDPETSPPSPSALSALLGERVLVEFVSDGGRLYAVTLVDGRLRLHDLASTEDAGAELESLRFSLRRLAHRRGSFGTLDAAAATAAHAAWQLDELIIGPLRTTLAERPLVLVPTGALHALPWASLPSMVGRPVSVCPSAALWRRAAESSPRRQARIVLVAGPGLPAAPDEIADIASLYPSALRFVGDRARVEHVHRAIDGATLVHIAAHGTFRADNALFSSLRLSDGPLTVYDLETLARAPHMLVLSACDSGLSAVHPGDELMGLASALLSLGTSMLVASVIPIPDDATQVLMQEFYGAMKRGLGPAAALATAQARFVDEQHKTRAAAAAFVCLGAD
jgi:tetratricopeptide (TPR) repeat protein